MITISEYSYNLYGCPTCGCIHGRCPSIIRGVANMTCFECKNEYHVAHNGHKNIVLHPREGIKHHSYVAPDIRPNYGEYWESRGVGYDLSGFVKSKKSGERILKMVKDVLGIENPNTYLDFRETEPNWIQFKFQQEEFDLCKLNKLAKENKGILTKEILQETAIL